MGSWWSASLARLLTTQPPAPSPYHLLRVQDLGQLVFDLVVFGEALGFELGVEAAIAEENLEGADLGGEEEDAAWQLFVIVVQDVRRQTGGAG